MAPALFFVCFKTPFLLQRAFWAILYTFVLALHTLRHKTGLFTWSRHKSVHFGLCVPNCCFLTGCTGTAFAASFMKTRPQNCLCSKPCPYLKGMPLLWLLPAAFAGNPRLFFLLTAHKPKHRHSPLQQTPKFAQSAISLAYFRLITDLFCGLF